MGIVVAIGTLSEPRLADGILGTGTVIDDGPIAGKVADGKRIEIALAGGMLSEGKVGPGGRTVVNVAEG